MNHMLEKKGLYLLAAVLFISCRESSYDTLRKYLDGIRVVDTHEHHFFNADYTSREYSFFDNMSYFNNDMISAGSALKDDEAALRKKPVDSLWDSEGKFYEYGRTTSYHAQLLYGYKKLYGFNKPYFTRADAAEMEKRVKDNYLNYFNKWFDSAFRICNFEIMLTDQCWNQYSVGYDPRYYALVFRIDSLVAHSARAATMKKVTDPKLLAILKKDTFVVKTLDEYIAAVDSALTINIAHKAVALKNALAYERSIDFEYVSYDEARRLFAKASPDAADRKKIQDYMFHWAIEKSIEYDLPIQIHTGFLAGNNSWLDRAQPMKLLPLLKRYPKARFVLFHGAYPWMGEWIALGKNFTNVSLDLVWLGQISRTAAIRTLHELLDCVPYNKICWGGDVGTIEESAGALELGKEVVATVLAERIEKGWLTIEVAEDIVKKIFRENAIRIYKLDSICGIKP